MFINSKNTILLLVKRKRKDEVTQCDFTDGGVKEQVGHIDLKHITPSQVEKLYGKVTLLKKAGRPKKKKVDGRVICANPPIEDDGIETGTVQHLTKAGRPKKKKEPLLTLKGKELKSNVPFIEGKSEKHYCDHCIKRDGEEYKEQTCSYRTPATANKSQWYRNHVAMNECPNCHKSLGIECLDWETLPKEKKK